MKKIILSILFFNYFGMAMIINVPDSSATIQGGIDLALNGDTVLVEPGIYVENLNFNGKQITVASLLILNNDQVYSTQIVIDGNSSGSVIIIGRGED